MVRRFLLVSLLCCCISAIPISSFSQDRVFGELIEIKAGDTDAYTFVPPPENLPINGMAANITVTYTGFSTEAQTAFQHAVDIWEALLNTSRTITINATWSPATNPNNLGSAGASSNWRNFSGAPAPDTFWPQPLAETLCDCDLGTDPDINANFNSDRSDWYFGTDGNTPAGEYDLVTVVLHEIGHGLGFSGGATVDGSGIGSVGLGEDLYPKYYDLFVKNVSIGVYGGYPNPSELMGDVLQGSGNLLWNGANAVAENGGVEPELYDPNPWNGGSSYSHFAESYYTAGNVNSLMTPFLSGAEAAHHPGPVTLGLLEDLGWSVNNTCDTVGCTDNSACNYDSDACFDDGTCDYGLWYIPLDVAASFTPMTQACSTPSGYTLADQDCAQAVIDGDTYCINTDWDNICMEAYNDCLYGEGCDWYIPDVVSGGPAVWACEAPVGYSIADQPCAQEIILADDWCVDNTWDSLCNNAYIACCPLGCIDSAACNYDSAACQDDSSCTYPGCNDPIACNYDSAAGCDDGSCTYLDSPVTDMTTYDWTLSWDSDCDGDPDETIVYFNSDQSWGVSSDAGTWSLCSGFYMHDYNSGPTTYEGSWDGTGFTGTFDTIDSDWSGCFTLYPIIPGCTDSTACNYDSLATDDDGSCCYETCVVIDMIDSFGDGWNGATYDIILDGMSVASGDLDSAQSGDGENFGTDVLCLADGCYEITVGGGSFNTEITWTLNGVDGGSVSGTAPQTVSFSINFYGCTDSTACNYDSTSCTDDGSCVLPDGCTNISACNYDSAAICDDGSCEYLTCRGCTGQMACNYDPSASIDDGSCDYTSCAGCTCQIACNYDSTATLDDESCEYTSCAGCTYPAAPEYDSTATVDDGSCSTCETVCPADFDGNSTIDTGDLLAFLTYFGTDCE